MLSLWDPFADFDRLRRELAGPVQGQTFAPAVDIEEQDSAFVLWAELPGVKREDLHIEVDDDVLTIKGERKFEAKEEETKRFQRVERRYGAFQRRFSVPQHVDASGIEANLSEGVLELRLPKKPEVTPRRIEVHAA